LRLTCRAADGRHSLEDAHWIDPTSRELLDLTVERVRVLHVLLIVTFRPEFQPPWTGQPQVSILALNRLDRRDRTVLVGRIAGGKTLPDEVANQRHSQFKQGWYPPAVGGAAVRCREVLGTPIGLPPLKRKGPRRSSRPS
jgi:hypothetical protein